MTKASKSIVKESSSCWNQIQRWTWSSSFLLLSSKRLSYGGKKGWEIGISKTAHESWAWQTGILEIQTFTGWGPSVLSSWELETQRGVTFVWWTAVCLLTLVWERSAFPVEKEQSKSFSGSSETSYAEKEPLHLFQVEMVPLSWAPILWRPPRHHTPCPN